MSLTLVQSVASPVRLFASSHMTLGRYGTALWIDSHTEDYFGHSNHGQRLAGSILTMEESEYLDDSDNVDPSNQIASSVMASIVFGVKEHDEWVRLALDEEEGRIAVACASGEISLCDYA